MAAVLVALAFIVFLFWHLNLHYMNLLFAVLGYRVFSVLPPPGNNPLSGRSGLVVITRRPVAAVVAAMKDDGERATTRAAR